MARRIRKLVIPMMLLALVSCRQERLDIPDLDCPLPPLEPFICVDGVTYQKIMLGQRIQSDRHSSYVRLCQIDVEKSSCQLEVENGNSGQKMSGWFHAEEYVHLGGDFGRIGLQIHKIDANMVVLQSSWGYVVRSDDANLKAP